MAVRAAAFDRPGWRRRAALDPGPRSRRRRLVGRGSDISGSSLPQIARPLSSLLRRGGLAGGIIFAAKGIAEVVKYYLFFKVFRTSTQELLSPGANVVSLIPWILAFTAAGVGDLVKEGFRRLGILFQGPSDYDVQQDERARRIEGMLSTAQGHQEENERLAQTAEAHAARVEQMLEAARLEVEESLRRHTAARHQLEESLAQASRDAEEALRTAVAERQKLFREAEENLRAAVAERERLIGEVQKNLDMAVAEREAKIKLHNKEVKRLRHRVTALEKLLAGLAAPPQPGSPARPAPGDALRDRDQGPTDDLTDPDADPQGAILPRPAAEVPRGPQVLEREPAL